MSSRWVVSAAPFALLACGVAAILGGGPAVAAPAQKSPATILPGTSSHDPINIDAGKLDYYDKEQKLIYSGNVVAVQGDSTLKASQLTIYLVKSDAKSSPPAAGGETAAAAATAGPGGGSSVKHMDAAGPVTLVSKDQIGTGDHGTYDKDENKVTLTGNVTLSQGPNVTKGDRLVYDLTSGQAQVFSGKTDGRVHSIFTPGSGTPDAAASPPPTKKQSPKQKPANGTASRQ